MTNERVAVAIRVRPLHEREREAGAAWSVEGNAVMQRSDADNQEGLKFGFGEF
jgi:hypothetical protein